MRLAILTSGGDAPGMNAIIVNLINLALKENHEVFLVENGYEGLMNNNFIHVKNNKLYFEYFNQAGSFIYSTRSLRYVKEYEVAIEHLKNNKIDCLIVIGGNGSYKGVQLISHKINSIFIPASIDNDIDFSDYSIGFSSATNEIVNQARKLIVTFRTHKNIVFLEVFGRYCSHLAVESSLIVQPALTLTHENKLSKGEVVEALKKYYQENEYALVIIAEFAYTSNEIKEIMIELEEKIPCHVRHCILGYTQRGADPTVFELLMANKFSKEAMDQINEKNFNVAIYYKDNVLKVDKYDKLFTR